MLLHIAFFKVPLSLPQYRHVAKVHIDVGCLKRTSRVTLSKQDGASKAIKLLSVENCNITFVYFLLQTIYIRVLLQNDGMLLTSRTYTDQNTCIYCRTNSVTHVHFLDNPYLDRYRLEGGRLPCSLK